MESDAQLLQEFTEARSEAAFAELVRRHLPLVYGAALRRVGGNSHAAQEVAQQVFTTLARKASRLLGHPALGGWLYTTTNHLSMKLVRGEQRRLSREDMALSVANDAAQWETLRPVIDDALLDLPEGDRIAVLLRFFQDESFPAIGMRLGLTDSGARMRTEHALESLRSALAKRGVTSTAAALAGAVAAHGAVIAPAGMAAAIAANAAAPSAGGLLLLMSTSTFKTGAMIAMVAVGVTGLVIQNRENASLSSKVALLEAELALKGREAVARFRNGITAAQDTQSEVARLRDEVTRLSALPLPNEAMASWALRLASLKQRMADHPEANIPEQRFLTDDDWLDVSRGRLETDEDYRKAMAALRGRAEAAFGSKYLRPALQAFAVANNNQFPIAVSQLQPHFPEPIESAIIQRWDVLPADAVPGLRISSDFMLAAKAPVDETYDTRRVFALNSSGSTNWPSAAEDAYRVAMSSLLSAYMAANGGKPPASPAQLQPYATTPEQQATLHRMMSPTSATTGAMVRP